MMSVLTTNHEVTRDLEFNHFYIIEMIEKFSISPNQCNKCNDLSKVFMNPEYYYNNLYIRNSSWKLNKDSVLSLEMEPYKSLKIPLFDIRNVAIKHPLDRPRGKIHIVRESSDILEKRSFVNTARISSISALRKLEGKPQIASEIAHKLSEDVDQGVLVRLSDF